MTSKLRRKTVVRITWLLVFLLLISFLVNGSQAMHGNSLKEGGDIIISPSFFDFGALGKGENISGTFYLENEGSEGRNVEISVSGAFSEIFRIDREVFLPGNDKVAVSFWGIIPNDAKAGLYATYFVISVKQSGMVSVGSSILLKYGVKGLSIISVSAPPTEVGQNSLSTFRVAYVGFSTIEITGSVELFSDNETRVFTGTIEKTVISGIISSNGSIISEEDYQKVFQVSFGSLAEGKYHGEISISSNTSLFDEARFSFIVGKRDTSIMLNFKPTNDANTPASLNVTISNKGSIPDHVLIKVDVLSGNTKLNHFEEARNVIGVETIIIYILPPAKGNYTVVANVKTDSGIIEQSYPLFVVIDKITPEKDHSGTSISGISFQPVVLGGIGIALLVGLVLGMILGKKKAKGRESLFTIPTDSFKEIWLFLSSGEALGRYDLSSGKELELDEAIIAKILVIFSTLHGIKDKYVVIKARDRNLLLVTFINDVGVALAVSSRLENATLEYSQVSIHKKLTDFVNKHRTNLVRGLVSISSESIKKILK